MILLRQLAIAGPQLRYHGDFEGNGIEIARAIIIVYGTERWRTSADELPRGTEKPRAEPTTTLGYVE